MFQWVLNQICVPSRAFLLELSFLLQAFPNCRDPHRLRHGDEWLASKPLQREGNDQSGICSLDVLGAQTATCRLPSSPGLCPKSWRETERYDHVHCDILFVVLQMVLIIELLPTQAILSVVSATHPLNGVLPYGWWFSHGIYFHIFHELSHSQKLKPWNFCCPCAKQTNHISICPTWNYLFSRQQRRVNECAFDGYRWSENYQSYSRSMSLRL